MKNITIAACILGLLGACSHNGSENNIDSSSASSSLDKQLIQNAGNTVYFAYDKSTLSDEAIETLKKQPIVMKKNPKAKFIIEGHCDQRGTGEYNIALGERRAHATKSFLRSSGVEGDRLDVISYGKEKLAVIGDGENCHSQNRRTVTVAGSAQ